MKRTILIILTFIIFGCASQKNDNDTFKKSFYNYEIDLNQYNNDQLTVTLQYHGALKDSSVFCMPKVVPGIYDTLNFGKFINNFTAIDNDGNKLQTVKIDDNRWKIYSTEKLNHITYKISDGWDNYSSENFRPYRSAESSFEINSFIINPSATLGYLKGHENDSFKLEISKPIELYAATSLSKTSINETKDLFIAKSYKHLVDNPIIYSIPDTTSIRLPEINIVVACYTTSGRRISKEVAKRIEPLIKNQIKYLGSILPTDNYTFIIYQNTNLGNHPSVSEGLEHSNSTVVLMYVPDDIEVINDQIYRVVSHEFFHTVTPLALHSFEISNFDYIHPKFSQHLWLYEGTTEYFTIHMLIKNKMQSLDAFTKTLEDKIREMNKFNNNLSITELSKDPVKYQDQYMNVYYKGALINLCLDIKLRELINGNYGVQDLIKDLIDKYGVDKPFEDDELFSNIVNITGEKAIDKFIIDYIIGSKPLPLKESLEKVGLILDENTFKISTQENISEKQQKLRYSWINQ